MTRVYTSAGGRIARAGRAHEDPKAMTEAANRSRMARHVAAALKENPGLTAEQAAEAGRERLRAEMTRLARAAADARRLPGAVEPPGANWEHGLSCYRNKGCRCDVCRDANSAYQADYYQRRKNVPA